MRILLIEDDNELSQMLSIALKDEGHEIDTCPDGDRGSFLARSNPYSLIILDNVLPKKNGAEVCQEIRKAGINTPIIITSALSETTDKVSLLDYGADDYLTKPFSFIELAARIKALSRRPYILKDTIMTIDDLTINPMEQKVTRGKKDVYLTRKEFLLWKMQMNLYLLMQKNNLAKDFLEC